MATSSGNKKTEAAGASAPEPGNGNCDGLDLKELLDVLTRVKKGDFGARLVIHHNGIAGKVADALNDIIEQNELMTRELQRMTVEVGKKGKISERAALPGLGGGWKASIDAVNELVEDLGHPISEVERVIGAVAKGDLSQTMDLEYDGRPIRGEFRRTGKIVNKMVDQLSSFASEVTRVAREVGTEGKLGGQAKVDGVAGTWKDITDNVNSMADNLTKQVRGIAEVTTAVANGDLSKKISVDAKGEIAELKSTINTMVDQLGAFASEVTRVAREVGIEGKLGGQAQVPGVSGTWKDLTDNVNLMADNLTTQVRGIAEVTTAVANGDLSKKISVDAQGEILALKGTINTMVDQLGAFASEVTRVAREVGTEGELGVQAEVPGVAGIWKDLTDNVNAMADNLTVQLRDVSAVATAIASGDLTRKITVDVKGEILQIKDVINTMVDQLGAFASEVTRVAREVGTEGKLGGQAEVPGVSGTWKDLTDNVNAMAGNLTVQLRDVSAVATAIASGDMTRKITVDVKGEILQIKDVINKMVDQLSSFASEVTRVAREVGTEGKLGGQAKVEGVSGTWKDLTDNVNSMADNLTTQVRGIAEVTTAVANGDLSKKISVDAKGEIAELKSTINTMVDQLGAFASEVTRVAREVGTEGKLGGQAEVPGVSGTWKDLTDNVNSMASNLTAQVRNIAEVTTAVANGDLSKKITVDVKGEIAELKGTINTMVDQLSAFASEVTRVAREVGNEGELGVQAEVPGVAGIWKDLTDNVNAMADNLTVQLRDVSAVATAIASGDLTRKITVDVKGEILQIKDVINKMVDQLGAFASEVTRVAREVGTEGKLGGQAEVPGVSGTWKDLTDNVNSMADNLTTQVRGIANVVTAVAQGDLSKKLTVDAKGEIAELADTINAMIDTLDTFADQVTTVAREVGTEGKLGGQAEVPGASGTWRDLTDNVNQLANNLTTQVRAITEVTKAVASGDLSKKITVEAAGEVADLKNNVNEMIRNLKETTRKNKEQDWLKTNLTKFTQLLQGQKDLQTVSKLILSELAPLVNELHGAFYLSETSEGSNETVLRLLATYAYKERRNLSNTFKMGEGLVGQCALERERILLYNVPDDYIRINSGLGEAAPTSIVVMPVLFEGQVKAVIELASFQEFHPIHLTFLDQLTESIGIVLNTLEANMRTEQLLSQSQSQQEALGDTNRRLEEKARSLEESEDKLRRQQETLRQTNRELEEKALLLAEQKSEVEEKNQEIEQARRALQEKAEQLALTSKYKSEFLANMSHELRTPLNSMLILSKMLSDNKEGNLTGKQVEYAETVYSSGADLLGLINEILDLSKIESGTMAVEVSDVGLKQVRTDLYGLFRQVAHERGLDFEISIDPDVPGTIVTDAKRLQQVLKNLISNALKFTDAGSVRLDVGLADPDHVWDKETLREARHVVAFSVSDTGIGISPDKQQVIFEAFQQADGSISRSHGGTGLGLSISREIARLLGGELDLESAPGEGSTFVFYLPDVYVPTKLARSTERVGDGAAVPAEMNMPLRNRRRPGALRDRTEPRSDRIDKLLRERQPSPSGPEDRVPDSPEAPLREDASQQGAAPAPVADVPGPSVTDKAAAERLMPVKDDRDDLQPGDTVLLIIEDDPKFASILLDAAHEKGFKAIVAAHAEQGMQLTRRYKPHAVTLDVRLPGMHGLNLLEQLKADPQTRHIPVTIISVMDTLPRSERNGVVTQLKKPVTHDQITGMLRDVKAFTDRDVRNLLVVEDDDAQRLSVAELIRGSDVHITAVASGDEALTALASADFDCAVIDLGLPDMDGLELVDKIRNDLEQDNLPVVIHTARDLSPDEVSYLNDHAEAVIVKDVESFNRLLSATALFLHRPEETLPDEQRDRIEQHSEATLAGRKVLIIDDDIRNIFALTSLLERQEMEIVYAESGEEGIKMLKETSGVDAVLMDIMMPGMDGYEATSAIRRIPRFDTLPIIAVTAKAMKGDREKCIEAGASDYITKPVNVEQLLSLLRLWLRK